MRLGEATIQSGDLSGDVKNLQTILAGQGYNPGPIDGNFGPKTKTAVQNFQSSHGLVPDGIVGPLTWAALHGQTPVSVTTPPGPATIPPSQPTPAPMARPAGVPVWVWLAIGGMALLGVGMTKRRA